MTKITTAMMTVIMVVAAVLIKMTMIVVNSMVLNSCFFCLRIQRKMLKFCCCFFKLNVLILVRVIKEMTAMEQARDNHAEQIR